MKELLFFCLRHMFLLAIGILILIGILYRQAIFGVTAAEEAQQPVAESVPPEGSMPPRSAPGVASEPPPAASTEAAPGPVQPESPSPATPPAGEGKADPDTQPDSTGLPSGKPVTASSAPQVEPGSQPEQVPQPEPLREAAPGDTVANGAEETEQAAAADPDSGDTLADLLESARAAHWKGDDAESERIYLELIDRYPEDPDIRGELGNIYFRQGALEAAVSEYSAAARLLMARGDRQAAVNIVNGLKGVAPGAAARLEREFSVR